MTTSFPGFTTPFFGQIPFGQFPVNQFPFNQFGGSPIGFGGQVPFAQNGFVPGFVPQTFGGVNTPWNFGGQFVNTTNGFNTPFFGSSFGTSPFGVIPGFQNWSNWGFSSPSSQFGFSPLGFNTQTPFATPFPGVFNTTGFNTPLVNGFVNGFNTGFTNGYTPTTNTNTQNTQTPASYPFLAYAFNPYFGFNTPVHGQQTQQVTTQAA